MYDLNLIINRIKNIFLFFVMIFNKYNYIFEFIINNYLLIKTMFDI